MGNWLPWRCHFPSARSLACLKAPYSLSIHASPSRERFPHKTHSPQYNSGQIKWTAKSAACLPPPVLFSPFHVLTTSGGSHFYQIDGGPTRPNQVKLATESTKKKKKKERDPKSNRDKNPFRPKLKPMPGRAKPKTKALKVGQHSAVEHPSLEGDLLHLVPHLLVPANEHAAVAWQADPVLLDRLLHEPRAPSPRRAWGGRGGGMVGK